MSSRTNALWLAVALVALPDPARAQFKIPPTNVVIFPLPPRVVLVNMTPRELSGEKHRDSEPTIAVNPANVSQIAGTALTPNPWGGTHAPIYISSDRGQNWALSASIPFNHVDTGTGDITLKFGSSSSMLYVAALRKDFDAEAKYALRILRASSLTATTPMTALITENTVDADQPWVRAISVSGGGGSLDRVFVGFSRPADRARVYRSLDAATAPAPAGFQLVQAGRRTGSCARDGPARPAIHSNGTIYAAFFHFRSCPGITGPWPADVVVVRDDSWATATGSAFTALVDPSDSLAGKVVEANVTVPYNLILGNQRLGSQIAIAVDPNDSQKVYLAWGSGTLGNYVIRVRRSLDGGATWSADRHSVQQATNPSLAVNNWGKVALLYQKLTATAPPVWQTWVDSSSDGFESAPARLQLHSATYDPALFPSTGAGPLGDYNDMMAVGRSFYGVFSANNKPISANFPQGVRYQRNANFGTQTLLALDGTTMVDESIDPFFFALHEPIINICRVRPWLCESAIMERGGLKLRCLMGGCVIVDPLPRNCLVKFKCPGCAPGGMCPPYYHLHLDGLDDTWDVTLVDSEGNAVEHELVPTRTGAVISFRPSKEKYIDGSIGSYMLAFEMGPRGKVGAEYRIKTRLTVGDRHYAPRAAARGSR